LEDGYDLVLVINNIIKQGGRQGEWSDRMKGQ